MTECQLQGSRTIAVYAACMCLHVWRAFARFTVKWRHYTRWSVTQQDFYEDIFEEVDKFGEIEHLNICDNLADHMVGNVYIKFK